ncbi:Psf2-domain-containing protein [Ramaria rubella]|nr:Psf2-domain-containing protein [Ramaria rubella]
MALPNLLRTSTTPAELELVAMEQLIDIVPLFKSNRIRLISGTYGPFRPPAKTRVPLWFATNLKLKKKCRLVAPAWLSVEFLQERLSQETSKEDFSSLPFRFAEIGKVMLDVASDDLHDPDKIRSLLKDLREARQSKTREHLQKINDSTLELSHLCSMEINEVRPFFTRAMDVMGKITSPAIPTHLARPEDNDYM